MSFRPLVLASVLSLSLSLALAPDAAAAGETFVEPKELAVVEHAYVSPPRGKDDKENYTLQLQIWGELRNDSKQTVRTITADVTFYDAAGKLIGIDSIGTASKKDVNDPTPGDRVDAEVHFVPPGASVPFQYRRNLAAIRGVPATHKITLRKAVVVPDGPRAVLTNASESVAVTANPNLPDNPTVARRRVFSATLENQGPAACRAPRLVISFFGPDGKIKDVRTFGARPEKNWELVVPKGGSVPVKGAVLVEHANAWYEKAPVKTYADCDPFG
ncbi:MAG: FxLYD domain-containing protein [Labilithrix sp.]|nr:FxLYD domain-containing protein [Labilithrix sp.]MCW5811340.1 FxLYD domain-containing protein [Labilithrix sp.]